MQYENLVITEYIYGRYYRILILEGKNIANVAKYPSLNLRCKSSMCKIPREARSMGVGERSVRIGTRVLTSVHKASWGEVSDVISSGW